MISPNKFLKSYIDLSKCCPNDSNNIVIKELYNGLESDLKYNFFVGDFFRKSDPTTEEMSFALDLVAQNIFEKGQTFLNTVFPDSDIGIFKASLENIYGKSCPCSIEKNGDIFNDSGMVFLEKQQIGMTVKDDIQGAIEEYERVHSAGLSSPAELLTLARFYGPGNKYEKEVIRRKIHKNLPMVVGGPASVILVDKEGHMITAEALAKAFPRFMKNLRTRNANAFHSDVQAGWIMPAYISKSGRVFKSGVNEKGLWVISEVRDDIRVAQRLTEEITKGKIRSYSIAGSATDTEYVTHGSQSYMQVNDLEIVEITFCEQGVNQGAHFDILKSGDRKKKSHYDYVDIVNMLPPSLPRKDIYYYNDSKILIKSEPGEVADSLYLELRKYVFDDIEIEINKDIPDDSLIVFKGYEMDYYSQLISNYPEFDDKYFIDFINEKTGLSPDKFDTIERSELDRIANDWLKSKRSIRPEFTTMFVGKGEIMTTDNNENEQMIKDTVDMFREQMPPDEFEEFKEETARVNSLFNKLKSENPNMSTNEIYHIIREKSNGKNNKEDNNSMSDNNKLESLQKFIDSDGKIEKQWQDEKMEFALNFEEGEKSRREKLTEFMKEMGLPTESEFQEEHGFFEPKDKKGLAEVKEDKKLPWQVNEAGVVDRS